MKDLSLALMTAITLDAVVVFAPVPSAASGSIYKIGYPPAFFAPAYRQQTTYATAYAAHADYARAYYDDVRYRGIITVPYYGWQIRWAPR
jgi:hypothetical protein